MFFFCEFVHKTFIFVVVQFIKFGCKNNETTNFNNRKQISKYFYRQIWIVDKRGACYKIKLTDILFWNDRIFKAKNKSLDRLIAFFIPGSLKFRFSTIDARNSLETKFFQVLTDKSVSTSNVKDLAFILVVLAKIINQFRAYFWWESCTDKLILIFVCLFVETLFQSVFAKDPEIPCAQCIGWEF